MEQNAITNQFIQHLKTIIEQGTAKSHSEVAEKINWSRTALSNVTAGRRNIPPYVYANFKKVYEIMDAEPTPPLSQEDYKEKYIALLESQVERIDQIMIEMVEMKQLLKAIAQKN